jgi:ABC-2 type transport system permease protein
MTAGRAYLRCRPFWIVEASRVAVGGGAWPAKGWFVIAGWTIVGSVLASRAYRRESERV